MKVYAEPGLIKILLVASLVSACCMNIPPIMATETATYKVLFAQDSIEVRTYDEQLLAEVTVSGNREQAANSGFRILADYIFGGNSQSQQIPMTAPVTQLPTESEKTPGQAGEWKIRFLMPKQFNRSNLPPPTDRRIRILNEAPKQMIAIRFSGNANPQSIAKYQTQLVEHIKNNKMSVIDQPIYAFYDSPFTLPMFKRNEVLYELQ